MVPFTAFLPSLPTHLHSFQRPRLATTTRRPRHIHTAATPHRVAHTHTHTLHSLRAAAQQDHYEVLNVPETADAQTIKRAYRRAALKNHPDVSDAPDARDRFLRVQEAYSILSNATSRAAYDRRRRAANFNVSDGFPGFGGATSFDTADFARKWQDANPMPKDINDSFGNIFSDLFSGVADAVSTGTSASGGVVEDFIDFLEKRVDGFSSSSSSTSSSTSGDGNGGDSDFDAEVLRSDDEGVLTAEIDDAKFVLSQLQQRKRKAQTEEDSLTTRSREWRSRAERAETARDYDTRDAARERETELRAECRRFARRVDETTVHIRRQEDRLSRLQARLKTVRERARAREETPKSQTGQNGPVGASSDRNSGSGAQVGRGPTAVPKNQETAIDDELEKMKRELGI